MPIKKAVITTAGFGTRFLPISKTIQKEMLPILDRPLVDYVVSDLVKAGIKEIIFVVSEHNQQIKHYYSENRRLKNYLKEKGKDELYREVEHLHQQAQFTFKVQPDEERYGTAVPVKICEDLLKDEEAFLVFMGDDFVYNGNGQSAAAAMIELYERSKQENGGQIGGVATFIERPTEELHKYGIAEIEEHGQFTYLKRLIEKPAPGTAPSNLSNISKYILTPTVFDIIRQQEVNPQSGELYITDTVQTLAENAGVMVHLPHGEYLDGGNVMSWLKANLRVAIDNPNYASELKSIFQDLKI